MSYREVDQKPLINNLKKGSLVVQLLLSCKAGFSENSPFQLSNEASIYLLLAEKVPRNDSRSFEV